MVFLILYVSIWQKLCYFVFYQVDPHIYDAIYETQW